MSNLEAWWNTAVLGLVQGITEFLPISSSAHLIAFKEALNFQEAGLAFDVALHVATLAAVLWYFRAEILSLVVHPGRWRILILISVATVPAVILGIVLSSWRDHISPWWAVGGWLCSAAYLLASKGRNGVSAYRDLSLGRGLLIGTAQALAIFPGVSRSGSSIVSGLWLGLERDSAFRFSFLLSIPVIAGAGLEHGFDLKAAQLSHMGGWGPLALGMVVAFLTGVVTIHFLLGVVRRGRIHHFGWYNLLASVSFVVFLLWKETT